MRILGEGGKALSELGMKNGLFGNAGRIQRTEIVSQQCWDRAMTNEISGYHKLYSVCFIFPLVFAMQPLQISKPPTFWHCSLAHANPAKPHLLRTFFPGNQTNVPNKRRC